MHDVGLLHREHEEIALLAGQLVAILAGAEAPEPVRFLHFRRRFGKLVTQHVKREDWVIYPQLRATGGRRIHAVLDRLCAETNRLSDTFGDYSRRWTSPRIVTDWPGYRRDSLAVLDLLRRRIAVEESQLYPLMTGETDSPRAHRAPVPIEAPLLRRNNIASVDHTHRF